MIQGSVPQPQGHEVANSLKYFSSTLLGVLKDVPGQPMVMMRCRERDAERLSLFPSLDYKGLYSTLLQFLDLVHLLQNGLYDFGKAFLNTLVSLKNNIWVTNSLAVTFLGTPNKLFTVVANRWRLFYRTCGKMDSIAGSYDKTILMSNSYVIGSPKKVITSSDLQVPSAPSISV